MTDQNSDPAIRDMRRFVEVSFGHVAWMSALMLVTGLVQAMREGLFSSDHSILIAGGVLSLVSGTYLYVTDVRRLDQSSTLANSASALRSFLAGGAEVCLLFFGLYLLLIRGAYRLFVVFGEFRLLDLLSALGFLLAAGFLLNGFRRLRKTNGFLDRLDLALLARRAGTERGAG